MGYDSALISRPRDFRLFLLLTYMSSATRNGISDRFNASPKFNATRGTVISLHRLGFGILPKQRQTEPKYDLGQNADCYLKSKFC
jgi:hypothetical protein